MVSFGCFISSYSKLIGWVKEENVRQRGLSGGSFFGVYELLIGVLIFFHCNIEASVLMYFDVVL